MRLLSVLCLCILSFQSFALDAYFKHNVFHNSKFEPYIEASILFNSVSLAYNKVEGGFQAQVELTYIFEQNGKTIDWSKTLVKSPITSDTVNQLQDFLDLQRFALPYGDYKLTMKLVDLNNTSDSSLKVIDFKVEKSNFEAFFSDIMLVQSATPSNKSSILTRGNMDMVPRVSNFYSPVDSTLTFYTEFYNANKFLGENEDFIISTKIINSQNDEVIDNLQFFKRKKAQSVDVLFSTIDLNALYSGNYILSIEARNRTNEVFASKKIAINRYNNLDFGDSNQLEMIKRTFVMDIHEDSLRMVVYCLRPRASTFEKDYIDKNWENGDTTELRGFLYGYWQNQSNMDPESAYKEYNQDIDVVREKYKISRINGCSTDRGRVYLQYGKPNTIVRVPYSADNYPYEIWHYYSVPSKSDAKFVFYSAALGLDDYIMLHSNVPGEYKDDQWYMKLSSKLLSPNGNDEPINGAGNVIYSENLRGTSTNVVGNQALDFWNNPR
jgi:GWxTD domain-containing protein